MNIIDGMQGVKDLVVNGYSWKEIRSTNPYMISFVKDGMRMNVYFTTMTITIQKDGPDRGKCTTYRKVMDYGTLEDILIRHK